ncbi:ribosome recycling factor [Scardovia wiggsiae F0424]|uniref:Ribosome-recycling factor n=1 Tax=Scardovia wiggsiae F0424 TaxID=857290 RepID=J0X0L2_9BIFI|nr:ribosome recycling factor [Scardovia wiggsiae]EJD65404.1 ribosome recycling factor [Scardovia wiggsiae F0424]MBF1667000.1 ribosome recycling factor [Scardovia wiggsiae]MBF1677535.1 ribosome recycling factor [Scardovia wiggsiae]
MATVVEDAQSQMEKTIESTKENFVGIRTGRANPALFNGLTVDYYGAPTPLKALASVGVSDNRTLAVTPFDVSQCAAIEKAIRDSDLGVNPRRDGNVIHVTLPELTEERRRDYVKLAREFAEKGKIAIRNIRRRTKEGIDTSTKSGEYGEDEGKRLQNELEKVTKKASDEIDSLLETKEKEILSV